MYTTKEVQAGIKFLQNKNVSLDVDIDGDENTVGIYIDVNANKIWTDGSSIWSDAKVKKGVVTHSINLIVNKDKSEGEDAYWSGGLQGSIAYDGSGKDGTWYDGGSMSYEDKLAQGSALINPVKLQDSDGLLYTDSGYIENCLVYMEKHCDFNRKLLANYLDFDYSEQGMQEDECVNLDADLDGDFWMHCNEELVKFTATKVA